MANTTNADWDIASPATADDLSDGAAEIRVLRDAVAVRINKEHDDCDALSAGGVHDEGSGRCEIGTDNSLAAYARDGAMYFDTDDNTFYVYDTTAWSEVGYVKSATDHGADGTHAEGSARIFCQSGEPTGDFDREGAVWFDTDDDSVKVNSDGTTWTELTYTDGTGYLSLAAGGTVAGATTFEGVCTFTVPAGDMAIALGSGKDLNITGNTGETTIEGLLYCDNTIQAQDGIVCTNDGAPASHGVNVSRDIGQRAHIRLAGGVVTPASVAEGDLWRNQTTKGLHYEDNVGEKMVMLTDNTTGTNTTASGTLKLVVNGSTYWLLTSASQN